MDRASSRAYTVTVTLVDTSTCMLVGPRPEATRANIQSILKEALRQLCKQYVDSTRGEKLTEVK